MGLSFLRFGFLVLVISGVFIFLPVHVVKREGRRKPTITARNILKKLSGCKKSLDRVKIYSVEQPV
jgi:hypothetical protein